MNPNPDSGGCWWSSPSAEDPGRPGLVSSGSLRSEVPAEPRFRDLFDLAEIQSLQDAFSSATGLASLITEPDGTPITRPSNFCRLCNDIIRKTTKGRVNCQRSDALLGNPKPGGPAVSPCQSGGLWDAGAPIYVGTRQIATWLIGQVRNSDLDEQRMLAYAREIGADEEEFRAALAEVTVMSTRQFEQFAQTLYLMANQMSRVAWENVQNTHNLKALREHQRVLLTLMSNLPGMAYRCRPDMRRTMEFVSEGCWEVTGYKAEDLTREGGIAYGDLIHEEHRAAVSETLTEAVARRAPFEISYSIRAAGGSRKWVWERGRGVHDADGRLLAVEGFLADITEQRRAEAENEALQTQLHRAQKMEAIGQLAGGVAHDFNNILTAILGYLELVASDLRERLGPEDRVFPSLNQVVRSAERAATLTHQLLAFSRRQPSQPTIINADLALRDLEKMLRPLVSENIVLMLRTAGELPPISADLTQFEQVVMNLVVNARDAMPDGGQLVIETSRMRLTAEEAQLHSDMTAGEYVLISVSDTGIGMDAVTLEHVFEPFFSTKPVGQGTGLGLATVYGIVKQAGGHVTVHSEPGHGSLFRVYWPTSEEPAEATADSAEIAAPAGGRETIVLCEDDESVRSVAEFMLREAGYTVLSAARGADALIRAAEWPRTLDLLLTDVVMPDMNGRRLAEELRGRYPGLRVLYMSGYTADVIAHHGVLDPGVEFLSKPFSGRSLLERVRAVLDRRSETVLRDA